MKIFLHWLGNAGFEFHLNPSTILVDPFLTRPKQKHVYSGRVEVDRAAIQQHIKACDHILVSHAHFDHSMDVPEIALRTGARIHGSANTCQLAHLANVSICQTHELHAGDEFQIEGATIKVIQAAHPWIPGYTPGRLRDNLKFPLRLQDYRMDACFSYLIQYHEIRILVWSSTRTTFAEKADVLICRAVSSQRWYNQMLAQVQPKLVIPSHWDDMFQPLSTTPQPFFSAPRLALPPIQRIDLADFSKKITQAHKDCCVLLPEIFKRYDLS